MYIVQLNMYCGQRMFSHIWNLTDKQELKVVHLQCGLHPRRPITSRNKCTVTTLNRIPVHSQLAERLQASCAIRSCCNLSAKQLGAVRLSAVQFRRWHSGVNLLLPVPAAVTFQLAANDYRPHLHLRQTCEWFKEYLVVGGGIPTDAKWSTALASKRGECA